MTPAELVYTYVSVREQASGPPSEFYLRPLTWDLTFTTSMHGLTYVQF